LKINFTIVFLLAATFNWKLYAQVTSNTHFTHLTTQDGLSNNWITCIVQDKTGYIWIGTQDGLNRYDSRHFKIYRNNPKNNNSIPNNTINGITFDTNGLVWVGTNNGLCSIDPLTDSITIYKNFHGKDGTLSSNHGVIPFIDQQNNLWVGTDNGLNFYNRSTGSFSTFYLSKPDEVGTPTYDNGIKKIFEDDQQNLWCLGVFKLCLFDKKKGGLIVYQTPLTGGNYDVVQKNKTTFFIAQWAGGLYEFDLLNKKFNPVDIKNSYRVFLSLYYNMTNSSPLLFIGNNEVGLTIYNTETKLQQSVLHNAIQPSSIIANQVLCIFKDREQSFWFGTSKGISILNPQMQLFSNYMLGDDLFTGEPEKYGRVNFLSETGNEMWVNAWPYTGLYVYDRNWKKLKHQTRIPPVSKSFHSQFVNYIHHENNISWFCTDSGLVKYNAANRTYKVFVPDKTDTSVHKEHLRIRKLLPYSNDKFIVRSWKWGIMIFDKTKEIFTEHYQPNSSDPNNISFSRTYDMVSNTKGEYFISTEKGLILYHPAEKRFITFNPLAGTDHTFTALGRMCVDKNDNIWICSDYGLFYFDTKAKRFTHYTTQDGLPVDKINKVCLDRKGMPWITTNVGISKLDPDKKMFLNFSIKNGLAADLFEGALTMTNDGQILAGFEGGVTMINPESYPYNKEVPAVQINEIKSGTEKIPVVFNTKNEKIVTLSYRQNSIQLSFSVLNFTNPQQNSYYYMLEDFNKDWQVSDDGYINYTNLAPGKYVLKVKGANNSGVMNEAGDKIYIIITPALWQTTWFRITALLLLVGSFILFFRRRIQAIRHEAELKQKIAETEMMALRAQMNPHFIFNSLNSIDNLIQTDQKEKATAYLARFAKLIRGILENSKQEVIPCWKDLEHLQLYLELEQLRWDNKFTSEVKIDDRILQGDYKVPPMVVQPFVENAIQHGLLNKKGNDRKVFISIVPENGHIKYIIEDNGVGREKAEEYKKVNRPSHLSMGLNITEQRIHLFNKSDTCSINIIDLIGKDKEATGTRVELILNNQV